LFKAPQRRGIRPRTSVGLWWLGTPSTDPPRCNYRLLLHHFVECVSST